MGEDVSSQNPSPKSVPKKSWSDRFTDKEEFPPKLTGWKLFFTLLFDLTFLLALGFGIWLCFQFFRAPELLPSCICWAYINFFALLVGLFGDRYIRHKVNVHKSRLEDPSEIKALFVGAETVVPRINEPETPEDFKKKRDDLLKEVSRLKEEGLYSWTEYQILPLNQMLVEFFKIDDLKAQAQSSLSELNEYAEDFAYRYEMKLFKDWEGRVEEANNKIENAGETKKDKAAEPLRAELVMMLEHVADYKKNWAHGSAVIRGLMICGAAAVLVSFFMGSLPVFYPTGQKLSFINWGFWGISGSLTSVLLYLYKSNKVEVGNTEGKSEMWRAVVGATLGFIAGILIYSLIGGELLGSNGHAIPDLNSVEVKDISLSILWAVGGGMFFENIFERMRGTFKGAS